MQLELEETTTNRAQYWALTSSVVWPALVDAGGMHTPEMNELMNCEECQPASAEEHQRFVANVLSSHCVTLNPKTKTKKPTTQSESTSVLS